MITGKTLIDLGYHPGRWFKEAINYANEHQLSGDALLKFLESASPTTFKLHPGPIAFETYIEVSSPEEHKNVAIVKRDMNVLMQTPTVVGGAIMPDACPAGPAGSIPVGGIVITENAIHPAMHSSDICCSVMMSVLDKVSPKKVLDIAMENTHFGGVFHDTNAFLPDNMKKSLKENSFLSDDKSMQLAQDHLGTQGDGNHFLFVGRSRNTGETVLVTHHGSRGLGARLFQKGMKNAERFRREISPDTLPINAWIPSDEDEGKEYWDALQKVRDWTKLNHKSIHERISYELGVDATLNFWNEHNFIFKEENLFYHAKGATPLKAKFLPDDFQGLRLVPLNMAEPILIMRERKNSSNFGFAPHGAGRNYSRSYHIKKHLDESDEAIFARETKGLDIRFYSGNIDISELPSAYKDAASVKAQIDQFNLGEVVDEIIPYGCIMAGNWQKNKPWKK
ncbi:MAG: RtcB family protein [Cyclobacteriaceae bacterium]|nr:RtcB family protein [Cyclobacteriaceae bacterium]MCH8517891.1 RtcB family protein [Cyclobacteriaceae bacterium]